MWSYKNVTNKHTCYIPLQKTHPLPRDFLLCQDLEWQYTAVCYKKTKLKYLKWYKIVSNSQRFKQLYYFCQRTFASFMYEY